MNEQYPADIIAKIKPAINRINEHTSLNIKLTIKRQERGKALFIFENLTDIEKENLPVSPSLPEDDQFKVLVLILPEIERGKSTILEAVSKVYKKHGFDYVKRNILYTNSKVKNNYRLFLLQSFKNDWALGWWEDNQAKSQVEEAKQKQKDKKSAEMQKERAKRQQARDKLETLPESKLKELRKKAIADLPKCFHNTEETVRMQMITILAG
jgi:hypothetical protein